MDTVDGQVAYDASSNMIVVQAGGPFSLTAISHALERPDLLQEQSPGEWFLAANLQIKEGATLRIAAPEVTWLKLRSDADGFVWIKASGGGLEFVNTCVQSWDTMHNRVDTNYEDGRSFILARDGAWMSIRGSELSYLGYDANESYGLAWRLAGTSGEIVDSQLAYNYYGLYTYEVSGLVVAGNEVYHSVLYGIDPHTRSNRLLITDNVAHHNGKHGIILAEECNDSIIRNNVVYANAMHGIVLYQDSNNNAVENNVAYDNGLQGININDASHNIIRSNIVYGNTKDGIGVGQDAQDNLVIDNEVRNNRKDGIYLFNDARGNVLRGNRVTSNERYGIYIKSEDNQVADGHVVTGNEVGVYLNVDDPPAVSTDTNRIYDNRAADIRTNE